MPGEPGDRSMPADLGVRVATPDDFASLPAIEEAADRLFATYGIAIPAGVTAPEEYGEALLVLVAGRPPVGFACLDLVDELPYLGQVAVHPDAARQGFGAALLDAAIAWAAAQSYPAITLTTFRDLPFNGPFYARHGFTEVAAQDWTSGLVAQRSHEASLGLDDQGARVVMRRELRPAREP